MQGRLMAHRVIPLRCGSWSLLGQSGLQQHRTVSEIAYGWGFSAMTHFGRAFKRAYGVLPSEYRRNVK